MLAAGNWLRMAGRSHRGPLPTADDSLNQLVVQVDRHVRHLAQEIGERNVSRRPAELARAADYIEAELTGDGYLVRRQPYEVPGIACSNLEVEIRGKVRPNEIVVVGAHYDTVAHSPGANDNGSGVAGLLALAHLFARSQPGRTLRFVAFVNEELPYAHTPLMGSRVYARRCRERGENVVAMLCLETIGYYSDQPGSQHYPPMLKRLFPAKANFIAFIGNTRCGRLVRHAVAEFRGREKFPCQGASLPECLSDISRSDHWSFWQEGYPAVMVTDTANFRGPHYHTPGDTADKVDMERTARVIRGLHGVIESLVR